MNKVVGVFIPFSELEDMVKSKVSNELQNCNFKVVNVTALSDNIEFEVLITESPVVLDKTRIHLNINN